MNKVRGCRQSVVRVLSARSTTGWLVFGGYRVPCAVGRNGCRVLKREGDGSSPAGVWPIRKVLYRADRVARPQTPVDIGVIRPGNGWCDAPGDRNYNRSVELPYPASAEPLWRRDGLYDLVVVLGHNDRPRVRGRGSAVFMHVARHDYAATEGCVALRLDDLMRFVRWAGRKAVIRI